MDIGKYFPLYRGGGPRGQAATKPPKKAERLKMRVSRRERGGGKGVGLGRGKGGGKEGGKEGGREGGKEVDMKRVGETIIIY